MAHSLPLSSEVVMDHGEEFMMGKIKRALNNECGTHVKRISTCNPQVVCMVKEPMHQTMDVTCSQSIESKANLQDGSWNSVLNALCFVMQATLHTTMRATPMQLVHGCEDIHNICFKATWQ